MLDALTEPERAAWMWRHGLVLDPHLVVCQVRDGAQILVLERLLDRHSLVLRPTLSLRLQLLTLGGHLYPLVAGGVASSGERDPPRCAVEGVDGVLRRRPGRSRVIRARLSCAVWLPDGQHALQRLRLQAEVAQLAHDGVGGIAIRYTQPGAPPLQLLCSIVGWTVRSMGSQVLREGTLR